MTAVTAAIGYRFPGHLDKMGHPHDSDRGESSSEAAARRLSITRRTLHRRLSAHGVTFEQLLDHVRFDLAGQLLQHSAASMTEIAVALNYANASAFTRAFRRWSGSTPSVWRDERKPAAQ